MWQVTWLNYKGGKPCIGIVTSPNEATARTVYFALLTLGWSVRLWTPKKELS
jgi:hypothetical protein